MKRCVRVSVACSMMQVPATKSTMPSFRNWIPSLTCVRSPETCLLMSDVAAAENLAVCRMMQGLSIQIELRRQLPAIDLRRFQLRHGNSKRNIMIQFVWA